jgi:hypothetical protein
LRGKRDYNVGSEFSPGCERFGDEEELKGEREKEKVERYHNAASEFSPGCERIGDEEELEGKRGKLKVKSG